MSNIIDITKYRSHAEGLAVCLQCDHEWVQISPLGTVSFECPGCKLQTGVAQGLCVPRYSYLCESCGNANFFIDPEGTLCARCGTRAVVDGGE